MVRCLTSTHTQTVVAHGTVSLKLTASSNEYICHDRWRKWVEEEVEINLHKDFFDKKIRVVWDVSAADRRRLKVMREDKQPFKELLDQP